VDENRGFRKKSQTLGNQSQPFYYLTKHVSVISIDVPRRWFVNKQKSVSMCHYLWIRRKWL